MKLRKPFNVASGLKGTVAICAGSGLLIKRRQEASAPVWSTFAVLLYVGYMYTTKWNSSMNILCKVSCFILFSKLVKFCRSACLKS